MWGKWYCLIISIYLESSQDLLRRGGEQCELILDCKQLMSVSKLIKSHTFPVVPSPLLSTLRLELSVNEGGPWYEISLWSHYTSSPPLRQVFSAVSQAQVTIQFKFGDETIHCILCTEGSFQFLFLLVYFAYILLVTQKKSQNNTFFPLVFLGF